MQGRRLLALAFSPFPAVSTSLILHSLNIYAFIFCLCVLLLACSVNKTEEPVSTLVVNEALGHLWRRHKRRASLSSSLLE